MFGQFQGHIYKYDFFLKIGVLIIDSLCKKVYKFGIVHILEVQFKYLYFGKLGRLGKHRQDYQKEIQKTSNNVSPHFHQRN